MDALRAALPADWQLQLEPEPVFGAQMLVVRAGPRQAPPLLLVHGLGQNGFTDWLPVMPDLAKRWRVLAVDLPAFGYSSPSAARLSPTRYAQVLARLLAREGLGPLPVVGHSMGGAVALRLAADHPRRVSQLVLADVAGILHRTAFSKHTATLPIAVENVPEAWKEPAARLRDLGGQLVERLFGLSFDPTELLRSSDWLWSLVMRDRVSVNAAMALIDENFSPVVWQLEQPVRLIWGQVDRIAPLRTGELLARRLPRARLDTLAGVGHEPMHQAPRSFAALLERALTEPPPALRAEPPAAEPARDDLVCRGEVDRRYSGRFREVRIERCTALRLDDVVADRIVVSDSIVQMTGVRVRADDVALSVTNSELVATACDLHGRVALACDAARLDLAGVRLTASEDGVRAERRSRLVASVSELRDAGYTGWWHEDRELEREALDPRLPLRPLPSR